jgi:hypothetical protein
MKKEKRYSSAVLLSLLAFISLYGTAQRIGALEWNGYVQTDNRFLSKSPYDYSWQQHLLALTTEASPNENSHFFAEGHLSYHGISNLETSDDLSVRERLSPWVLDIQEAYVDLYGFPHESIDLRIGKQRIAWGTADNLNPTDNLNPDDLEDIWDFGNHMGSVAVKASFYWGNIKLSAIYLPSFTPALLPSGNWSRILSEEVSLPGGLTAAKITDRLLLPSRNVKESSSAGFKIEHFLLGYDLSLSYVYGRDDLPLAHQIALIPTSTPSAVDIEVELMYPRMHIVGFDFAGGVWDIGIWGEMAVFIPEEVLLITDLSLLGMGIQESVSLDDEPYPKYVMGMDYTFTNGIYLNGQYLHGFTHERGSEQLEDYLMIGVEWKSGNGKWMVKPLQGGFEIKDFDHFRDNYTAILSPEITYIPMDGMKLSSGYRMIEGNESTTFGKMKEYDEIYFKVKYSF